MVSAIRLALLLLAHIVAAEHVGFTLHDSNDRPTEFKDGLPAYVNATIDYD